MGRSSEKIQLFCYATTKKVFTMDYSRCAEQFWWNIYLITVFEVTTFEFWTVMNNFFFLKVVYRLMESIISFSPIIAQSKM